MNINYTYVDSKNDPEKLIASDDYSEPFPQAWTPKHSSNSTIFWQGNGLELRLAHRYNSVQLASETATVSGAAWQDSTNRLDFSASYRLNKDVQFTFHALNLTDDVRRTFYTSTKTLIPSGAVNYADDYTSDTRGDVIWNEGNALDGNVDKSRTISEYKTGINYRVGVRVNF
ncbi:TonB-dependent receptor domain-containing protein [Paraglaciecola aquimarina]|uniref:TonB-dependent receptor domain-containing protein n=1 Tax=Paraglaciecola aquimarina TaxID=1235557 RepID=UPI003D16BDF1